MERIKNLLAKVNVNWHKQPGKAAKLIEFVKLKKPVVIYADTGIIIAAAGIIISLISFIGSINIIKNLIKDKSYGENELYLIASIMTSIICICILTWGIKRVTSDLITIIRDSEARPEKFENYQEVEDVLIQEKTPSSAAEVKTIREKDESFIRKYLFFLGFIILFLIGKNFIPDEFYWNLGVTSGYFSFPLVFMVILSIAAALRLASMYFHRDEKRKDVVDSEIIPIKGADYPSIFAPEIEKTMLPLRQNGSQNIVFQPGFNEIEENVKDTGKVEGKIFIETQPKHVQSKPHPIGYIYLLFAVTLFIAGFLFVTKIPPDNIYVPSVPTIAIGHLWTIVKGGVLVFCGRAFMESVSSIFRADLFESVMAYVNFEWIPVRTIGRARKGLLSSFEPTRFVRNDCHFRVYTTKLSTEIDKKEGKRRIIKKTIDQDSGKAKKLIINAIKNFKKATGPGFQGENVKKILILSANPKETGHKVFEKEVREIEEGLLRSKCRGQYEIHTRWAVRVWDLRRSLLDYDPQIVHFTGYGTKKGLMMEDELGKFVRIPEKAISDLFELLSGKVECVILSAWYSESQAKAINKHIKYVIGMPGKIDDKAVIEFSVGFYDALGAGKSVEEAFKFGRNGIQQKDGKITEDLMPKLI